jgi:hypothetical protein
MRCLYRLDDRNWVGGKVPQAGQTPAFPPSFSNFGSVKCAGGACSPQGSVVSLRGKEGTSKAEVAIKALKIPNGKLQIIGEAAILFKSTKADPKLSDTAMWDDHGEHGRDATCAANWVVQGTASNPDFLRPCVKDAAVFPEVRACIA